MHMKMSCILLKANEKQYLLLYFSKRGNRYFFKPYFETNNF